MKTLDKDPTVNTLHVHVLSGEDYSEDFDADPSLSLPRKASPVAPAYTTATDATDSTAFSKPSPSWKDQNTPNWNQGGGSDRKHEDSKLEETKEASFKKASMLEMENVRLEAEHSEQKGQILKLKRELEQEKMKQAGGSALDKEADSHMYIYICLYISELLILNTCKHF